MTQAPPVTPAMSVRRAWVGALVLAALLALGYGDLALGAQYVHDDGAAILGNPLVNWPPDLAGILHGRYFGPAERLGDFPSRPLVTLTFCLEVALGLTSSAARHAVQLGLWWAAGLLVRRLLRRWLVATGTHSDRADTTALIAAALFLLHPVHVEAVMQVAYRPEVLALIWLLLGTDRLLSLRLGQPGRHLPWLALWTASALLSKESSVSVLALWGVWALATRQSRRALLKPLLLLAPVALSWLAWRRWNIGSLLAAQIPPLDNPLATLDAPHRLLAGLELTARAAQRMVLPIDLAPDYTFAVWPAPAGVTVLVTLGALWLVLLATLTAWAWRTLHGRGEIAGLLAGEGLLLLPVGWLLLWLPVSQLLTPSTVQFADRLLTSPSLLAAVAAALALHRWTDTVQPTYQRLCQPIGMLLLLPMMTLATRAEAAHWQTPLQLFAHGVEAHPKSLRMQANLAHQLVVEHQPQAAIAPALAAVALDPTDSDALATALDATLGAKDCQAASGVAARLAQSSRPLRRPRLAAIGWGIQCHMYAPALHIAQRLPDKALKGKTILDIYVLAVASGDPLKAAAWAQRFGVDPQRDPAWLSAAVFAHTQSGNTVELYKSLHQLQHLSPAGSAALRDARARLRRQPPDAATTQQIVADWPELQLPDSATTSQ